MNQAELRHGAVCDIRPVCERLSAGKRHEAARAAGIMAAVTGNTRRVMTDPAGGSQRGGRVPAPGGGGRSAETWKRHIVRQLKHRDLSQHAKFQDLIRFCTTDKSRFNVFSHSSRESGSTGHPVCSRVMSGNQSEPNSIQKSAY